MDFHQFLPFLLLLHLFIYRLPLHLPIHLLLFHLLPIPFDFITETKTIILATNQLFFVITTIVAIIIIIFENLIDPFDITIIIVDEVVFLTTFGIKCRSSFIDMVIGLLALRFAIACLIFSKIFAIINRCLQIIHLSIQAYSVGINHNYLAIIGTVLTSLDQFLSHILLAARPYSFLLTNSHCLIHYLRLATI